MRKTCWLLSILIAVSGSAQNVSSEAQTVQKLLDASGAPQSIKVRAWDAYYGSDRPEDFASNFAEIDIPSGTKNKLFDLKFSRPQFNASHISPPPAGPYQVETAVAAQSQGKVRQLAKCQADLDAYVQYFGWATEEGRKYKYLYEKLLAEHEQLVAEQEQLQFTYKTVLRVSQKALLELDVYKAAALRPNVVVMPSASRPLIDFGPPMLIPGSAVSKPVYCSSWTDGMLLRSTARSPNSRDSAAAFKFHFLQRALMSQNDQTFGAVDNEGLSR